ncbi:hypothetical protein M3Y99_00649000 [Aphelenchoides fujianensis]|nr:hypothetical protein M3Y99_00649000 [Aphelenchoides fujianensis]
MKSPGIASLDRKERFCGLSAHNATFAIGLVFMLLDALDLMTSVYTLPLSAERFAWAKVLTFVVDLLSIVATIAMLHGNRAQIPQFYLPFILVQVVEIAMFVTLTVCHVLSAAALITAPERPSWVESSRAELALWSLGCALLAFFRFFYGALLVLFTYTLAFEPLPPPPAYPRSTRPPTII